MRKRMVKFQCSPLWQHVVYCSFLSQRVDYHSPLSQRIEQEDSMSNYQSEVENAMTII